MNTQAIQEYIERALCQPTLERTKAVLEELQARLDQEKSQ